VQVPQISGQSARLTLSALVPSGTRVTKGDVLAAKANLAKAELEIRKGPVLAEIKKLQAQVRFEDFTAQVGSLEKSHKFALAASSQHPGQSAVRPAGQAGSVSGARGRLRSGSGEGDGSQSG
jgi:hypothetical protein